MSKIQSKQRPEFAVTFQHHIFIEKELRNSLLDGNPIETVGMFTPVWFWRGKTSEPAAEIFAQYTLINDLASDISVNQNPKGFTINIGMPWAFYVDQLSDEQLASMSERRLERWHLKNAPIYDLMNLADKEHGGNERLSFSRKESRDESGMMVDILHFIKIADVEQLESTIA